MLVYQRVQNRIKNLGICKILNPNHGSSEKPLCTGDVFPFQKSRFGRTVHHIGTWGNRKLSRLKSSWQPSGRDHHWLVEYLALPPLKNDGVSLRWKVIIRHSKFHGSIIDYDIPWNIPLKTPWNNPLKKPWFQSPPTSPDHQDQIF